MARSRFSPVDRRATAGRELALIARQDEARMSNLHPIVGLLLAAGISVAAAAPPIPSSELPGRERDRFTDSPVERFMRPGPYQSPPLLEPTDPRCDVHPSRHSKTRSAGRKGC
jgi:hypothetical protein